MISSNRAKRAEDHKLHRSDAINRYMGSKDEQIEELKTKLFIWQTTCATLIAVIFTVGFGLQ